MSPRLARAIVAFACLVATACGDAFGSNEAANARYAAGDYQGALDRYRALQREQPDLPELAINAGNALHRLGAYARALTNYELALASADPKLQAIARYDRGNTLFRLGRLEEAREAFTEVLRADPSDRDAKFNIEVIDRLRERQRQAQQQSGAPGTQGQPPGGQGDQQQQPSGGAPQQQGQPPTGPGSPGSPGDGGASGDEQGPSVGQALGEFRKNLTQEEALRLLDALRGEQRGVQVLLEGGPPRRGTTGEPAY